MTFQAFSNHKYVTTSPDLHRICAVPRRSYTAEQTQDIVTKLSSILKTPQGLQTLLPVQALALLEIGMHKGLLGPIRVGGGKTLISLLSPVVLQAWRPLLLVPAHLAEKTRREMVSYTHHWKIPKFLRIESYQLLGRPQAAELLANFRPDVIICDEVHYLRNRKKAAVAKRVSRYMSFYPGTVFVAMSGTLTKRSLQDYAHLARWALKQHTPLPIELGELEEWSDALDEKINPIRRIHPGSLIQLCNKEEQDAWNADPLTTARKAFRRRLVETPGVVATEETQLDCSLSVTAVEPKVSQNTEAAFDTLRSMWVTPDGWEISDPMSMWRHARELALGFYYRWNPRPPEDWLEARQAWARACRAYLSSSRTFDSEGQVTQAIQLGELQIPEYGPWTEIRDTFEPNTEPVWLDDSVVDYCCKWLHRPGILWTEHTSFAERVQLKSGKRYYGKRGECTKTKDVIEDEKGNTGIVASIASNGTGRNLQVFSRNLFVSAPPNGAQWEQTMGRTHRRGQTADEVTFSVVVTCVEHAGAIYQSIRDAQYIQDSTGQPQKLIYADKEIPGVEDLVDRQGPRWNK